MKSPFPGMNPYLEHPSLWTDVHNRLIAAIADVISPEVAPDYYVALERRAYLLKPDDIVFVGRPDISIVNDHPPIANLTLPATNGVMEVDVPMTDEIGEDYLEIHEVKTGRLVTMIEVLSPTNKVSRDGREQYLEKRSQVLTTRTNFVEIDLLRGGEPMPVVGRTAEYHYRILISPGNRRPKSRLYGFNIQDTIPSFNLPLLPEDKEPEVHLNSIMHDLYQRARFDLRLDYTQPTVPRLTDAEQAWADSCIQADR